MALGKVKVESSKFDYYGYRPADVQIDETGERYFRSNFLLPVHALRSVFFLLAELAHVLEVSGFCASTNSNELLLVLTQQLHCAHIQIKWVDDTHALAVFPSQIAGSPISQRLQRSHSVAFCAVFSETGAGKRPAADSAETAVAGVEPVEGKGDDERG